MRRIRLSLFGLGLLAAMPSFAGPAGTLGPAAIAAPDKVYPPLPTLAMLPPASGGGSEPAPATTGHRKVATLKLRKSAEPMPRMVVSDASHAYLASIEHQLEQALQK
ncbi:MULTISPECIES: hypothetical protein [Ralstonia solanacearum species complex]|uniref:hypothetical protein n=1 Tax=Ralstonia solanacearum species complex TaxID=3116862 RepID=UPI0002D94409|nr:hypothetical protein [Ralstonia pseudosolanacearum]ARS57222.1 hypothetical protein BC427_14495 [Ralstonia solanacearum FJAT-91]AXV68323.1 hypothetical protein CJO74_02925 [Ralstonia solanacearum]ESS48851.1 signal peptide protein [Ralstonia solanacearum SD54]AXV94683.1 hypothetical protein CJO80_03260 [Ralstonia solanacearum]AXV99895.1 hypothetical protein CJO81_03445 [Ralstonia solanacearum]